MCVPLLVRGGVAAAGDETAESQHLDALSELPIHDPHKDHPPPIRRGRQHGWDATLVGGTGRRQLKARSEPHLVSLPELPIHDAHEDNHAAIRIVIRVEDERAERLVPSGGGRRHLQDKNGGRLQDTMCPSATMNA